MSEPATTRTATGKSIFAYLNAVAMTRNLWSNKGLTIHMAKREIVNRYRNSWLGLLWSVITPLALLAIYTFVFAVVFKTKWGDTMDEGKGMFALTMFCGMLVFNMFAEVINRAPLTIVDNANYVKKVVFPLESLIISNLMVAAFNMLVGMVVWLVGWMIVTSSPPPITVLWLPIVLVPVILTTLGIGWILAAIGVFLRDIGHLVILATQVLFFATPIFYRIQRVPESFRPVMSLNPLSHAVEDARHVMLGQEYARILDEPNMITHPDWLTWLISVGASLLIAIVGYAFFMKSRRAFSDVL